MNQLARYKKLFLHAMIASLVVGALVGIISILIGSFSDTSGRVIVSLLLVIVHSLTSFFLIPDNDNDDRIQRLKLFYETSFVLLIFSFATSLLATWEVLDGDLTMRLYVTYLTIGTGALIMSVLKLFENKSRNISLSAMTGLIATGILQIMVILAVFADDSLNDFYYRLMAVVGIVMGTSIVITTVLYKLYLQSHPDEKNVMVSGGKGRFGLLKLLGILALIYISLNVIASLFFLIAF